MPTAVKSLADLPKLGAISTAAQEERLMSFLRACPETPAYSAMANQLGILEEGAKIILARLGNKGLIHFISRNPPRIMLTENGERPYGSDAAPQREGAASRYLDAEGERMRLGRYIADCERCGVRPPTLREMMDFVGFGEAGYVRRMAEILSERGLIQYGHGVPTRLTPTGREFFGVKSEGAKKMENAKVVVIPSRGTSHARNAQRTKAKMLCEALAEKCRADPDKGSLTRYTELSVAMGYAESSGLVSDAAKEAVRLGWLRPKPPKSHGLFFTEKGRAKFMPETVEEGMPGKPEIAFPDRVAKDSPLREAAAEVFGTPNAATPTKGPPPFPPVKLALDFRLSSDGLTVMGSTNSRTELAAFMGKLGALMPFLGE